MRVYFAEELRFPKTGAEVVEKAKLRIEKLEAKLENRKRFIAEQAKELGIASVEDALTRAEDLGIELSPENSIVHSKMLNNVNKSKKERAEIEQLEMIVRNLPLDQTFELKFDSLQYFGF